MTRTHALRQLLNHGPLSFGQLVEITGWQYRAVRITVKHLVGRGEIAFGRHGYQLCEVQR